MATGPVAPGQKAAAWCLQAWLICCKAIIKAGLNLMLICRKQDYRGLRMCSGSPYLVVGVPVLLQPPHMLVHPALALGPCLRCGRQTLWHTHMPTSVITSASDHQHCIAYGMVVAPQTEPGPLPVQSLMTATACAGMLFDGRCPIDVPCRADSGCNVQCFACKPAHLYQPLQRHVKHCTGCWLCISGAACTRAVVPLAAGHQCGWMSAVGLQL